MLILISQWQTHIACAMIFMSVEADSFMFVKQILSLHLLALIDMKKDLVYILIDSDQVLAFGNLKTLLESIHAGNKYSTVWRKLYDGHGSCEYGAYRIERTAIIRAPYTVI